MSEENNVNEVKCNCFCHSKGVRKFLVVAAGTFVDGATIELSCDAPIREPYIAYMQGGLTYEYGKLGVMKAIEFMR